MNETCVDLCQEPHASHAFSDWHSGIVTLPSGSARFGKWRECPCGAADVIGGGAGSRWQYNGAGDECALRNGWSGIRISDPRPACQCWGMGDGTRSAIGALGRAICTDECTDWRARNKPGNTERGPIRLYRLPDGGLARYDGGKRVLIDDPFGPLPNGAVDVSA